MSRKNDRSPLAPEWLQEVLDVYNPYVDRYNTHTKSPTLEDPSDDDKWCPLMSWFQPDLKMNRHLCFVLKNEPDLLITIELRKRKCYKPGKELKNKISLKHVRAAYFESLPDGFFW